jgi:hypothetical protein
MHVLNVMSEDNGPGEATDMPKLARPAFGN